MPLELLLFLLAAAAMSAGVNLLHIAIFGPAGRYPVSLYPSVLLAAAGAVTVVLAISFIVIPLELHGYDTLWSLFVLTAIGLLALTPRLVFTHLLKKRWAKQTEEPPPG